jgi:GTP-binding protein
LFEFDDFENVLNFLPILDKFFKMIKTTDIKQAEFVGSFVRSDAAPKDGRPEYAFIGRSNVGKSSLVNMLTAKAGLAKVSNTPGKTQTINYFDIDKKWYMVDLPGYGYARISRTQRAAWEKMIWYYLSNRATLQYVFLLLDAMIPPQDIDMEFMNKLGEFRIPFVIAYTKTDRMKSEDLKKNIAAIQAKILESWEVLPPEFITSAEKKRGKNEVLTFIEETNKEFAILNKKH